MQSPHFYYRKQTIGEAIWEQKFAFFSAFFFVVLITYGVLSFLDFVPNDPTETPAVVVEPDRTPRGDEVAEDTTPDVIIIDALDKEVAVLNPSSSAVSVLDQALLEGVVRHPESANLLEEGTVFLFGHSSGLPNIINKNFQAFNGIQKLTWGDKIRLQSDDFEYVYRVEKVYEAKASTASIELQQTGNRLVLATCNSFGSKDDRFIVEAVLVDSYPL